MVLSLSSDVSTVVGVFGGGVSTLLSSPRISFLLLFSKVIVDLCGGGCGGGEGRGGVLLLLFFLFSLSSTFFDSISRTVFLRSFSRLALAW